jgi:peptide/nickel transport system ATP-binding protein
MKLLDLVMLPTGIMERRPYELSGGQQQRVAIARALALKPQMIVMDEPVSALDMSTRGSVLRLLKRLKQEFGIAYLYISHDLMTVSALCDRVIILRHGQIEEEAEVGGPGFVPESNYGRELYNSLRLSRATGKPVSS